MFRVRQQIGYDTQFFCRENPENYAVAIVDSGIIRHPDLEEQVIAFYDFSNEKNKKWADSYGHGTHVAGCLAGNGKLSSGRYHGICPNAKLVVLKVLNKDGIGEARWLLEALRYINFHHKKWNIRVVNLSLGIEKDVKKETLFSIQKVIDEIIEQGIHIVCAAGNYGPNNNTIYGIGTMEDVITVGCYDGIYENAYQRCCRLYSGRGDKASAVIKPDIVAPGTHIISCSNKCTGYKYKKLHNAYEERSGTSMSTPIISGILFGILLNYPNITRKEARELLFNATTDIGCEKNMQGRGFIDCKKIKLY